MAIEHISFLVPIAASAKRDLADIWDYTEHRWSAARAERYFQDLSAACGRICEKPYSGKLFLSNNPNLRAYHVKHHHIFYLIQPSECLIIAFLHERMDMLQHLSGRLE